MADAPAVVDSTLNCIHHVLSSVHPGDENAPAGPLSSSQLSSTVLSSMSDLVLRLPGNLRLVWVWEASVSRPILNLQHTTGTESCMVLSIACSEAGTWLRCALRAHWACAKDR